MQVEVPAIQKPKESSWKHAVVPSEERAHREKFVRALATGLDPTA